MGFDRILTGVVAGFGKLLASWVVSRRRKRAASHAPRETVPSPPQQVPGTPSRADALPANAADAKIAKKLAKAEIKRKKKAGGGPRDGT